MTNPTPHGQVPEALIDLIDAYAETRHRYGGIYNARTEAARNAVIEALSGVQALSAAPAVPAGWKAVPVNPTPEMWKAAKTVPDPNPPYPPHYGLVWDAMLAATPTPPAEQQATKETSGGFHVWRDISTAPKDGSRFVATGHNYGLYSEVRHTCVAQWFRGCWMEASDWNETSELKYLTHWMPLPSPPDDVAAPAEQQAAPKAAPVVWLSSKQLRGVTALHGQYLPFRRQPEGRFDTPVYLEQAAHKAAPGVGNSGFDHQTAADFLSGKTVIVEALREFVHASRRAHDEKTALSAMLLSVRGVLTSREAEIAHLKKALLEAEAAPQQEAQAPVAYVHVPHSTVEGKVRPVVSFEKYQQDYADGIYSTRIPLYTAPLPAPDCHHRPPCDECAALAARGGKV